MNILCWEESGPSGLLLSRGLGMIQDTQSVFLVIAIPSEATRFTIIHNLLISLTCITEVLS